MVLCLLWNPLWHDHCLPSNVEWNRNQTGDGSEGMIAPKTGIVFLLYELAGRNDDTRWCYTDETSIDVNPIDTGEGAKLTWDSGSSVRGRSIIVTGAAGGIGCAVTKTLLELGANVTAIDRNADALEVAFKDQNQSLGKLRYVAADLGDLDGHDAVVEAALESGPIAGLVHCAAVIVRRADINDVSVADWDLQNDVNLRATFFLCRRIAEEMRKAGTRGSIVTFASQAWWTGGFGGSVAYAATKGGVVALTRGLARAYGSFGITVNCVSPGQARTEMLLSGLDESVLEALTFQTPLARIAEPAEVANVAVFLLSENASFITGSTLNVSGGFLMY